MTYQFFSSIISEFNNSMIDRMDFNVFSDQNFMKLISEQIPNIAKNQNFIKAINDGTLNEFLKTINHDSQYKLFDLYNKFCKDLPLDKQTEQMQNFSKPFEALKKLHDSKLSWNALPLCNWLLIGLAIVSLIAAVALVPITLCFASGAPCLKDFQEPDGMFLP